MRWKIFLLFMVFLFGMVSCSSGESWPVRSIELDLILDLNSLSPGIDFQTNLTIPNLNRFGIDNNNNIYMLDVPNHRIMVFDYRGVFIQQFGGIGQKRNSLYKPCGLFIENEKLYVLDQEGRRASVISLGESEKIASFDIGSEHKSKSIFVYNDEIFANKPYKKNKNLVTVFSKDGIFLSKVGALVDTGNYFANSVFNSAFIFVSQDSLFGSFRSIPVIFRYDLNKGRVFYREIDYIWEIREIEKEAKMRHVDNPGKIEHLKHIRTMTYCTGFYVYGDNILYALNYDRARLGTILGFNGKGLLTKKIIPRVNGEVAKIESLVGRENGDCFLFVRFHGEFYLAKFNIWSEKI